MECVLCAGFIQPPGPVHCLCPPSNPRLDGQRIYTYFAKYPGFIHRPALGWTVKDNSSPDLKACRKCWRSLHLLVRQSASLVQSRYCRQRRDMGESSPDRLVQEEEGPSVATHIAPGQRNTASALQAPAFSMASGKRKGVALQYGMPLLIVGCEKPVTSPAPCGHSGCRCPSASSSHAGH